MLRYVRIGAWLLVGVLVGLVARAVIAPHPDASQGVTAPSRGLPLAAAIGGPFTLQATTGGTISSDRLKGKPFALFFGYTFCPDVCPTTLLDLSNVIKDLGPDADRMRYLFVSVDPARDSIDHLKLYLSSFDPHIIGATGTEAEIADLARKYHAIYEKAETKDGYTINHTASTYLMDAEGRFQGTFSFQDKPEVVLAKLRRLIGG